MQGKFPIQRKTLFKYILLLIFSLTTVFNFRAVATSSDDSITIDSLKNLVQQDIDDTLKVKVYRTLSKKFRKIKPEKSLEYCRMALSLCEQITTNPNEEIARKGKELMGASLVTIGMTYQHLGNYKKAISYYMQSLNIREQLGDKKGMSGSLNNIGVVYNLEGDFDKAINYYLKSLKLKESLNGVEKEMSQTLNNLGVAYLKRDELTIALDYFKRSLKLKEELGNELGIATGLNNIGIIYRKKGEYKKSLEAFNQSLEIDTRLNNKKGISYDLNSIGTLYHYLDDNQQAMEYYIKSLKIKEEMGDKGGITIGLLNIAIELTLLKEHEKSLDYLMRSKRIAEDIGAKSVLMSIYKTLAESYAQQEIYDKAFEYHSLYGEMKDSLFNEDKSKEIGKLEAKYEMEKKMEEEKRLSEEEERKRSLAESRRNNLQYSGILIFIVLLFATVSMLGKIAIPVRLAEGIIFFAFLLFFEFLLVLSDPYIETYSQGSPLGKLGFNAIVAALVFPLHSFFEEYLKRRIFNQKSR